MDEKTQKRGVCMLKMKFNILSFFVCACYSLFVFSKHFILISAPGSGKGTFSQYMAEKYGYVHIGKGDIYRQRVDDNLSVDNHTLMKIMKRRILKAVESGKKFIFDNAIDSEDNFEYWKSFFKKHKITEDICFVLFEASDETCINRIKNRLICRNCCYVSKRHPEIPAKYQRCIKCGNKLSTRIEDSLGIIIKWRFKNYYQKIDSMIPKVEKSFNVIKISSEQSLKTLYDIYDTLHDL